MSRQKNQKRKILEINDIIRHAEGERNALSTREICDELEKRGVSCDRRTLADDFEILAEFINSNDDYDYCLASEVFGRANKYYSETKENNTKVHFDVEELKKLIIAVNSLKFTDDVEKADIDSLKNKLISSSPLRYRKRLTEYADDNYYILDTIAAKILIDSIHSLSFMNGNMSNRIIKTLINLADSEDRSVLETEQNNPIYNNDRSDGITLYEIDKIFRSIDNRTKLSFKYFDLDENRNRIYRHDGKDYIVEPLTLLPNDNHYYLICYDKDSMNGTRTYRIDKMSNLKETDEEISGSAFEFRDYIPRITNQVFRMYSGPVRKVTLEFENSIIGNVFDKFGTDVKIERVDEKYCRITEEIQISPPFFGWLFQFSKKMHIISPDDLIHEYKKLCDDVINDRIDGYFNEDDKL